MEFEHLIKGKDLQIYHEISEYAEMMGLKKKIAKTKDVIHYYIDPESKERILKFSFSNKSGFGIHLRFNNTRDYSKKIETSIRKTLEESDFKYTGCYQNCTKCDGSKGYIYKSETGKEYFRCYIELIELRDLSLEDIEECKRLIFNQIGS